MSLWWEAVKCEELQGLSRHYPEVLWVRFFPSYPVYQQRVKSQGIICIVQELKWEEIGEKFYLKLSYNVEQHY